ncbi:hypothetical protein [Couchioplanes azureus]|uniref:hypothetical protein n=1 Tax=Couchioplanes caeruleus TaxID=56438 RepID=UPI00167036DD|nr:hypothetical protein [Couchioplanes caeruleus]GGQ68000.1 hypothetical protein GCM10010166_42500 [Couchioplanes caeruleus subsp. azureus]
MPVRSELHPLVERFARVRHAAAARYGPGSQAVSFLLYEELISVRTLLAADRSSTSLRSRAEHLVPAIQRWFDSGGVQTPAQAFHRTVAARPTVIEFDRACFEHRYRGPLDDLGPRAVHLHGREHALAVLDIGASYLYAVDDAGALRVWPQSFRLADLVFGWAPGRQDHRRVVHPMLVPERLRVRAAGELVVAGSPTCVSVVANLKSGHFRPPPDCAAEVRRAVVSALELPEPADVDVFTMPQPATADPIPEA